MARYSIDDNTETFRYDLASWNEPRLILITNTIGPRSTLPRLGYVVIPTPKRFKFK